MPPTLRLDATAPADLARAADLLRAGRLVAFPTETVYGLGAHALDPVAVASIFAAKQRPSWDPLIVHLADASLLGQVVDLEAVAAERVRALAEAFWPGPLTLLLPRAAAIPDAVTAGRPLVGVRIPAHPVAQALLRAAQVPVAAPSANRFGHTSPTTAQHVLDDLNGRIDAVLEGGPCEVGLESTVLDPALSPAVIYRPGAIAAAQIAGVLGVEVELFKPPARSAADTPEALPSPGVGIRHYAPRARLALTGPSAGELGAALAAQPGHERPGVLLPTGWRLPEQAHAVARVMNWGAWDDLPALAQRLFAALRAFDDQGCTVILAPLPEADGGLADALRDRMRKAARPA